MVYGWDSPGSFRETGILRALRTLDDVTQGMGPATTEACRRKYSTWLPSTFTSILGDWPPVLGDSSQRVPSSDMRSPAAPRLMPRRLMRPLISEPAPRKVHISASWSGT